MFTISGTYENDVTRNENGSILTSVYRKSTYTDQYLQFDLHPHSCFNTNLVSYELFITELTPSQQILTSLQSNANT